MAIIIGFVMLESLFYLQNCSSGEHIHTQIHVYVVVGKIVTLVSILPTWGEFLNDLSVDARMDILITEQFFRGTHTNS